MAFQGISSVRCNSNLPCCLAVAAPLLLIASIALIVCGALGQQWGIPPMGCEFMIALGVLPIMTMIGCVCPCFKGPGGNVCLF